MIKNIDIHNVYYDLPYNTSNSKGVFIPKDHHLVIVQETD